MNIVLTLKPRDADLPRLTNLITGGTLVTYITVCVNYLFFYRALKAQGFSRTELPYRGYFQPYGTWIALIWLVGVEIFYGYAVFLRGRWDVGSFFSDYTMAFLVIGTFTGWKIVKRTRLVRPQEADLVWVRPAVDAHEAAMEEEQAGTRKRVMQVLQATWKGTRVAGPSMV